MGSPRGGFFLKKNGARVSRSFAVGCHGPAGGQNRRWRKATARLRVGKDGRKKVL